MTAGLITFTLAAVLIVLLPGPDTLVVVRNLVRGGRRNAVVRAGRVTGWMNHPVVRRRLGRFAGTVFIGFGVRLATQS